MRNVWLNPDKWTTTPPPDGAVPLYDSNSGRFGWLPLAAAIQDSSYVYAADVEASDDYVIAPSPAIAAYAAGQLFHFKAATANTGACTLNVNAKGAVAIKKLHDQDLATGDIEAGQIVTVVYDGTYFQMQSQTAAAAAGGGSPPTGTGFRHVVAGAEDAAAKTVDLASADVTGDLPLSNLTPATAGSKLLGRRATGAGDFEEVGLGAGLSIIGAPPSLYVSGFVTPAQVQDNYYSYAADAGASDDYAITVPNLLAYAAGQVIHFKANTANTGACTLNVNAKGAVTIKKLHDQDLATGDIEAGQIVTVVYDGTYFQMQSQTAAAAAGGGSMATDTLWDAAGDLAIGTGADTGGRLAIGAAGQLLRSNGTNPAWTALYSIHQYVFTADTIAGSPVAAGTQVGCTLVSGPADETVTRITFLSEVAGTGVTYTIEYGPTDDDEDSGWAGPTKIHDEVVGSGVKGHIVTAIDLSPATIPARRRIRMNLTSLGGTYNDLQVIVEVRRPLAI